MHEDLARHSRLDDASPSRREITTKALRPSSVHPRAKQSTRHALAPGEAAGAADDDLEQRIAYYRERAARKLPLFADLLNAPFAVEARYK